MVVQRPSQDFLVVHRLRICLPPAEDRALIPWSRKSRRRGTKPMAPQSLKPECLTRMLRTRAVTATREAATKSPEQPEIKK